MYDDVKVSVYCLAYNHEKYIRDALEGFVMQKTDFKFEVIVHDDASTDGTADIIREYEKKYPDIIKPIYQTENQLKKGVNKLRTFIFPKMRGEYVAVCEGDDFWSDENKLQIQFDIMKNNPKYLFCTHKTRVLHVDNPQKEQWFPDVKYSLTDGMLSKQLQLDICLNSLFHMSSWFIRRSIYEEYVMNKPDFAKMMPVGDGAALLYFAKLGGMYYIDKEMSIYRKGTVGSWTVTAEYTRNKKVKLDINRRYQRALILWKDYFEEEYQRELIDKAIRNYRLIEAFMTNDIQYIFNEDNKQKTLQMPVYIRLKLHLCHYIPFLDNVWDFLKCLCHNTLKLNNRRLK